MGKLNDKIAIITGAGSGFGRVGALRFAKEGAKVVVAELVVKNGEETVKQIKSAGGEALFIKTDVTKAIDCEKMVKAAVNTFGKLDIIWNNAGLQPYCMKDVAHTPIEDLDRFIDVNIKGVWYGCHYAAYELVKTKGVILNSASVAGSQGNMACSIYSTTKGAVKSMTYSIAYELGLYGVRCNCISPYTVQTPTIIKSIKEWGEGFEDFLKDGNALKKLPTMDDVVDAALFLVSDESKSITAFDLRIDCGSVVRSQPTIEKKFREINPY